ncbi:hypothetical protein ZIOFF_059353 [Zingiber officinale]|uniref:Uncharacterized protein n=1 Tax=Zingiber officinale TaxID=94328 RepID=A0A8J5KG98_ZINOF|nr:hypothetical protein ZIOFF_059353 [Zingiber officinale]
MIRNSPWTTNSFLLDATLSAVEQPDVAEWMKDVGVTLEDVDSLLERILDYWKPNKEDEAKKNRKMMINFLSMSSRQAILVELKEMACLLNYQDGNAPFNIGLEGTKCGNTILARAIYHHPGVRQHFQYRIWLDAPSSIDFKSNVIAFKEIVKENDIFSARNCLEDIQIDVMMKICSKYWLQKAHCKKLKELPRQIHKLRNLQILKLACCLRIQKLSESITCLVNLKELDVGDCCYLSKLPDDLSDMKNLMQLKMHGCASLTRMPIVIRQLTNMEVLW